MLRLLLLFAVLIAGIIFGPMLANHQGYVLIQTDTHNIETSITGLVLMIMALFLILFGLEWLLRRIMRTGAKTRGWFTGRKRHKAQKQTKAALLKLAEGDYQQVEKLLTRNAKHSEQPVVNYLLAAEAAQQRGDDLRTNQYLELASEEAGMDQLPVDIVRARIQLAQDKLHAARHNIDKLLEIAPRHPEVLRLAEQIYLKMGSDYSLLDILPSMRKIGLHDDEELHHLEQQAHLSLMNQAMTEGGSEGLQNWWAQQSRKIRHDATMQFAIAEHFIECDDHATAQKIIVDGLKRQYDERLIGLIGKLRSGNPEQLEKELHHLIKKQGETPLLTGTLGCLLIQHGEWQKAVDALTASLKLHPSVQNYSLLADALEKLQRHDEAAEMRHKGLLLTLQGPDKNASPELL